MDKRLLFMECKNCGKEVVKLPKKKAKEFCNSTCRSKYWQKQKRKSLIPETKVATPKQVVEIKKAIAKQFKVPLRDSLGRPNVINLKMNAEAKYVVSPVNDLDSALRYLEQYVIKDSSSIK